MNGVELQRFAAEVAQSLPASEIKHPFGPDWDVFTVRDKIFMLQSELPRTGVPVVILKSDPQEAAALRDAHADITPGYHMNKRHWITLHPDGSLEEGLVEELVTDSYLAVVAGLPKRLRPVDPYRYGSR